MRAVPFESMIISIVVEQQKAIKRLEKEVESLRNKESVSH
jgi:hypothetical protein